MTRRPRRASSPANSRLTGANPVPSNLEDALDAVAGNEPEDEAAPEPFGGKGDHDGDGRPGGIASAVEAAPEPPREKTLHELNLEARAIDRHHAALREAAEAKAREEIEPMLVGVVRPRQRYRRYQKNLRAPVTK